MAGPLSIAIIGAGMGGLATAAALRRIGVDVTVYEQASQFARIGAGIQIGCNAMQVLRGLGLEARLRAQSFYPRSWNNRDWRTGDVKFDMIFGESAERKFGAPYLLAHRGDYLVQRQDRYRLGLRIRCLERAAGVKAASGAICGADRGSGCVARPRPARAARPVSGFWPPRALQLSWRCR